jgi:hypothetical protein
VTINSSGSPSTDDAVSLFVLSRLSVVLFEMSIAVQSCKVIFIENHVSDSPLRWLQARSQAIPRLRRCVAIGVLNRKRPRIHRPMMLMASLVILTGATGRIPLISAIFGFHTWIALFGSVVSLGALLLLVRLAMTRTVDREFATGYAALVVVTVVAARLAVTNVWINWAGGNYLEALTDDGSSVTETRAISGVPSGGGGVLLLLCPKCARPNEKGRNGTSPSFTVPNGDL